MLHHIVRYILGICFVLSGALKAVAPHAFAEEVQLYGDAYVGEWLHGYAMEAGVAVSAIEITLGAMTLLRRCALYTAISLCTLLLFFVYLTGINLFFPSVLGSIESCGCFGELLHFTPVSSFVKSVTLMALSVINMVYAIKK